MSVYEAKAKLSALIKAVQHGEEVTILSRGKPAAKLVPAEAKRRGGMGMDEGLPGFWIADDFDKPLPDDFWFPEDES